MGTKRNTYSYVGVTFIILVFGIWVVPKIINQLTHEVDMVIIGDAPSFSLLDQEGKRVSNKTYKNKIYVLDFFFTSCPGICVTMSKNMKIIQNAFFGNHNLKLISISIDPDHDNSERLKRYGKKYGAGSHWSFLTGNKETIYTLANKGFGIYAGENPEAEGGFEHSGMFALVDQNGKIRSRKDTNGNPIFYYDGTDPKQILMLKQDISKLMKTL